MATEHDDDNLTDEERELLAELDEELGEAGIGEPADDDEQDDDARAGGDAQAAAKPPVDDEPPAAKVVTQAPELHADDTAAKAALDALKAEKASLRAQYDEGDIDRAKYDEALDAINDKILDARAQVQKADLYRDMTEQVRVKEWDNAVGRFLGAKENAVFREGPMFTALDSEIRKMNANEFDAFPDHADRLAEAKRRIVAAAQAAVGGKVAAEKPAKARAVDLPPGLDDVPGAADDNDTEFAFLDRLTGTDYERAFAKLNKDQLERYMAR